MARASTALATEVSGKVGSFVRSSVMRSMCTHAAKGKPCTRYKPVINTPVLLVSSTVMS